MSLVRTGSQPTDQLVVAQDLGHLPVIDELCLPDPCQSSGYNQVLQRLLLVRRSSRNSSYAPTLNCEVTVLTMFYLLLANSVPLDNSTGIKSANHEHIAHGAHSRRARRRPLSTELAYNDL